MDSSPGTLLRVLLPKTPLILKTTLLHSLSLSSTASKQDLKTSLVVSVLRSLLEVPSPMAKQQHVTSKDPGIKGPMWISKAAFAVDGEGEVKQALVCAIDGLKAAGASLDYTVPDIVPVEVEWTGHRSGVDGNTPDPSISEQEKYIKLMSEVKSPVTVLYFHGGAYCACDPTTHRLTTAKLATLTSGRVCSVRYRLAPQNPFPSALLDALVTYLSLLAPPPGSLHEAVDPSNIVFAGDSAGGNLALVLLQLLLELRRQKTDPSIRFHGKSVQVQLPVGVAVNSPWTDISKSMPSTRTNTPFDYLPSFSSDPPRLPEDHLWPTKPPRVDVFTTAAMLDHPLVSPIVITPEKWTGAPPVFMCLGTEMLADEIRVTAKRIRASGSTVCVEVFEGMPHCFAMLLPDHPAGRRCFGGWADFISRVVSENGSVSSEAKSINPMKAMSEEDVGFETLTELGDRQISNLIREKVALKVQMERDLQEGSGKTMPDIAIPDSTGEADAEAEEEVKAKARL